jgi:hypothetical protein
MVSVHTITNSMFPEIYAMFLREDDPCSSEDHWKNLFEYPGHDDDSFGYALVDVTKHGAKIVGMLGTFFSERTIGGRTTRFCNLHSWMVEPAYRGHSLRLMKKVLGLKDCTLTDFTPTQDVCAISRRLGFRELDSTLKLLPPLTAGFHRPANDEVELVTDLPTIASELNAVDQKICREHQRDPCKHLLVRHRDDYCYIVYTTVERHWIPYSYMHYVSNKRLFAELSGPIRAALTRNSKARYVAIDARVCSGIKVPWSVNIPAKTRQLYKSHDVAPEEIDSLYSELCWLNITTYPHLSNSLRSLVPPWRRPNVPRGNESGRQCRQGCR